MQVLDQYKEKFTADFADNKKLLDQLAVVRSKGLKNEMAGYITKLIKREKDTREEPLQEEIEEIEETVEEEQVEQAVEESDIPQEITIESAEEPAEQPAS